MKCKDLQIGKLYEIKFGYEVTIQMLTDIVVEHGPFPAASKLYRFYFLHGKETKILDYRTFMAEEFDLFNVIKEHL